MEVIRRMRLSLKILRGYNGSGKFSKNFRKKIKPNSSSSAGVSRDCLPMMKNLIGDR